ncbi:uncharacterized protein LOC110696412 [Chenopodium quinoa]|uniref:uncharacterized protein LOC110696412 n=1 Tax=Chenopodium quinoa TaxID=63459 RepID=UPI000B79A829|nr:uncharacterized protein LOC110696412 [Chenopodium quinoa]
MTTDQKEYVCLTAEKHGKKHIYEKLPAYSSGLYRINIRPGKSICIPSLRGEKVDPHKKEIELIWNATQLLMLDPRTNMCEQEVKKIVHLQSVANQLPDAFVDTKKVTKSHIPAENAPARIEIPTGNKAIENES